MFMWPTSELPIWPAGSPTSSPEAISDECGKRASSASYVGVLASAIALAAFCARSPHPSRTTSTSGDRDVCTVIRGDGARPESAHRDALECGEARESASRAELLFDAEQLVVFRDPIGAASRSRLDLS